MCQPLDFYGFNSYTGVPTKAGPDGNPVHPKLASGYRHTLFLWKVTPEVLYWGPKFMAERYKLPIVITENGMSNCDWVALDGGVHDGARVDYLHRHLRALCKAIREGADVRGYFQWSIMDNFEWAEGYKHRFGLIHVDFETQKRTLKDSAFWYRRIIETNGASLDEGIA
jgi:beta-glucosidase